MNAALLAALILPGVKITLEAPEKTFRPGQKMVLRFVLENDTDTETQLEEPDNYLEGLEIRDPEEKVIKGVGKTKGIARRTRPVEAGGFIGRSVDISSLLNVDPEREGWHSFQWSFGDGTSNKVRVLVLRDWLAEMETTRGKIAIEFLPQVAPNHVLNFLKLSRSGFYDGTLFYRVIPGFMMQGGRPEDPAKMPKKTLTAEFSNTPHGFGTVSMARRDGDPNSAVCEFFICFETLPFLDSQYTAFGRVVKGEDWVRAIEKVKTDHGACKCGKAPSKPGGNACCGKPDHHIDKPDVDVVLKKITLTERMIK